MKAVPAALDAETRVHDDHHVSLRLWLRLLSCTNQVEGRVRQNLQSSFNTTLPRFDLMAQLERAPQGLKMSELSAAHDGDRRQRHRHHRRPGEGRPGGTRGRSADRRVYRVKLTAEGERQFRRMAAEHERWVVDLLGVLSPRQKKQLLDLLGELKDRLTGLNGA